MIISRNEKVKIPKGNNTIMIYLNVGELILNHGEDGYDLFLQTENGIHTLCDGFKRLGCVNRYARCYGIEFERG